MGSRFDVDSRTYTNAHSRLRVAVAGAIAGRDISWHGEVEAIVRQAADVLDSAQLAGLIQHFETETDRGPAAERPSRST